MNLIWTKRTSVYSCSFTAHPSRARVYTTVVAIILVCECHGWVDSLAGLTKMGGEEVVVVAAWKGGAINKRETRVRAPVTLQPFQTISAGTFFGAGIVFCK